MSVVIALLTIFTKPAATFNINPTILEGVCRYESDSGRIKAYHNRNKTWDVGYCMNNIPIKTNKRPVLPTKAQSIRDAAKELHYWKKQHKRFCVRMVRKYNKCGSVRYGKWRGIKNCKVPHHWYQHYNNGFRVSDNYGDKVFCFIKNGYKKCSKKRWKALRKRTFTK